MHRRVRVGAALAGLAAVLAATAWSTTAGAAGPGLVVWADNSANTAKAIEPLCKAWAAANGVTCTVKKFNGGGDLQTALTRGNGSGAVPDVFEGPHDQIGGYVQNGILAPVDIAGSKSSFLPAAVAGVTYAGKTYGVPWAVENVALFTNKALAPTCPATLDAAVANARKLIKAGKVTRGLGIAMQISTAGDAYHWFPLFSADGGYTFAQKPDGTFDKTNLGIGKAGSIAAGKRLQTLVRQGILKASVTYDIARETFGDGKSPYFITGPWQVPEQTQKLGKKLMICPIPGWKGSKNMARPFVGVRVFMVPAKAKNKTLAMSFLQDTVMTTKFMDGMYKVDPRPPAWLASFNKAIADPIVKGFGQYGKSGIPTPSIPQMSAVWADLGLAEYKIASGANPVTTMAGAAASINKQNKTLG